MLTAAVPLSRSPPPYNTHTCLPDATISRTARPSAAVLTAAVPLSRDTNEPRRRPTRPPLTLSGVADAPCAEVCVNMTVDVWIITQATH